MLFRMIPCSCERNVPKRLFRFGRSSVYTTAARMKWSVSASTRTSLYMRRNLKSTQLYVSVQSLQEMIENITSGSLIVHSSPCQLRKKERITILFFQLYRYERVYIKFLSKSVAPSKARFLLLGTRLFPVNNFLHEKFKL